MGRGGGWGRDDIDVFTLGIRLFNKGGTHNTFRNKITVCAQLIITLQTHIKINVHAEVGEQINIHA